MTGHQAADPIGTGYRNPYGFWRGGVTAGSVDSAIKKDESTAQNVTNRGLTWLVQSNCIDAAEIDDT